MYYGTIIYNIISENEACKRICRPITVRPLTKLYRRAREREYNLLVIMKEHMSPRTPELKKMTVLLLKYSQFVDKVFAIL